MTSHMHSSTSTLTKTSNSTSYVFKSGLFCEKPDYISNINKHTLNVLSMINHIPCSTQIDGLWGHNTKALPPAEVVAFQAKKKP